MAFKDLGHLPVAEEPDRAGMAPDRTSRFGAILAERWAADAVPLARAHPDARFRHSDAGNCARAIGYAAIDLPASNPMDISGTWVTGLGKIIHEMWQEELPQRFPGSTVEVKVHDGRRAGHVDAVVTLPIQPIPNDMPRPGSERERARQRVISIEGKSVGGYKYQLAVGAKGKAEGPSASHILQAAMNGLMLDADEVVIVYWSRDAISVQQAKRKGFDEILRFTAEWTFPREVYEPLARKEIERVEAILAMVDEGMLPARKIPELTQEHPGSIIVQPSTGAWVSYDARGTAVDSGTAWNCAYCRWQDTCATTKPGRIPIEDVVQ